MLLVYLLFAASLRRTSFSGAAQGQRAKGTRAKFTPRTGCTGWADHGLGQRLLDKPSSAAELVKSLLLAGIPKQNAVESAVEYRVLRASPMKIVNSFSVNPLMPPPRLASDVFPYASYVSSRASTLHRLIVWRDLPRSFLWSQKPPNAPPVQNQCPNLSLARQPLASK
jgi:hypothetical protein